MTRTHTEKPGQHVGRICSVVWQCNKAKWADSGGVSVVGFFFFVFVVCGVCFVLCQLCFGERARRFGIEKNGTGARARSRVGNQGAQGCGSLDVECKL